MHVRIQSWRTGGGNGGECVCGRRWQRRGRGVPPPEAHLKLGSGAGLPVPFQQEDDLPRRSSHTTAYVSASVLASVITGKHDTCPKHVTKIPRASGASQLLICLDWRWRQSRPSARGRRGRGVMGESGRACAHLRPLDARDHCCRSAGRVHLLAVHLGRGRLAHSRFLAFARGPCIDTGLACNAYTQH